MICCRSMQGSTQEMWVHKKFVSTETCMIFSYSYSMSGPAKLFYWQNPFPFLSVITVKYNHVCSYTQSPWETNVDWACPVGSFELSIRQLERKIGCTTVIPLYVEVLSSIDVFIYKPI